MNMELSLPNLAILVCLSLVSLMIAFNASGPIRATLSYGLTTIILIITIAIGVLGFNSIESPLKFLNTSQTIKTPPIPDKIETTGDVLEIPTKPKDEKPAEPEEIEEDQANPQDVQYAAAASKLIRQAQSLAQSIKQFKHGDPASMTDEQYETSRQKVNSLVYRASALSKKAKNLGATPNFTPFQKSLLKALNLVRSAAQYSAKFYSAESSTEEQKFKNQAQSLSKKALSSLYGLKAKLK